MSLLSVSESLVVRFANLAEKARTHVDSVAKEVQPAEAVPGIIGKAVTVGEAAVTGFDAIVVELEALAKELQAAPAPTPAAA